MLLIVILFSLLSYPCESLLGFPTSRMLQGQMMGNNFMPSYPLIAANGLGDFKKPVSTTSNMLPWSTSIEPTRELVYMPMLNYQLDKMKSMAMKEETLAKDFEVKSSSVKPAKIGNMCFSNDKFRRVRLTYFDAGDNVQVILNI